MHPPTSFRKVCLLAAAVLVSATPPRVEIEVDTTVTETVTLPLEAPTPGSVIAPKIVEVTTVALSTVTVFSGDSGAAAPTLGAEVPASINVSGNGTIGPFLTSGPANVTLDAVSSATSTSNTNQTGSVDSTPSASQATITGTKNSSAIAIDRSVKAMAAGFLIALAL
ncbi:hypothetical protein OQA88_987 [Cercophora sp. LCS_1]